MNDGMRVVRCRRCRQMFAFEKGLPPACCPKCQRRKDEQFQLVRALVREMPGITALEVHVLTEVPVEAIMQFVQNGDIDAIPLASADDKELDERISLLVQKAKEKRNFLHGYENQSGGVDSLGPASKGERINWLYKD